MKLALCIPTAGNPKWQFTANLGQHLCGAARAYGFDDVNLFMRPGLLPQTREICLIDAIRWGAERILWLDDDMSTEPNPAFGNLAPLAGLMQVMDEHVACGFVGATYLKQLPRTTTVGVWHPTLMTKRGRGLATVLNDIPAQPFQCATVGAGFSLMRVSAAQAIVEKSGGPLWEVPLEEHVDGRRVYMNDDVDLCLKMHEHGFEVWADPRPITTHYKDAGPLVYDHHAWEATPTDLRPFSKKTVALFRDEATRAVALDMYTPAETRAKPGYEFFEVALEKR